MFVRSFVVSRSALHYMLLNMLPGILAGCLPIFLAVSDVKPGSLPTGMTERDGGCLARYVVDELEVEFTALLPYSDDASRGRLVVPPGPMGVNELREGDVVVVRLNPGNPPPCGRLPEAVAAAFAHEQWRRDAGATRDAREKVASILDSLTGEVSFP